MLTALKATESFFQKVGRPGFSPAFPLGHDNVISDPPPLPQKQDMYVQRGPCGDRSKRGFVLRSCTGPSLQALVLTPQLGGYC